MARLTRGWSTTSMQVPPQLIRQMTSYCAMHNTTKVQVALSLWVALLTGDIKVEDDINRALRVNITPTTTIDDLTGLKLYDKEGNLLNPTKYTDKFGDI